MDGLETDIRIMKFRCVLCEVDTEPVRFYLLLFI